MSKPDAVMVPADSTVTTLSIPRHGDGRTVTLDLDGVGHAADVHGALVTDDGLALLDPAEAQGVACSDGDDLVARGGERELGGDGGDAGGDVWDVWDVHAGGVSTDPPPPEMPGGRGGVATPPWCC